MSNLNNCIKELNSALNTYEREIGMKTEKRTNKKKGLLSIFLQSFA